MPIPDSFLSDLRDRADVESLISSYVTLKRRGKTLTGLCPFHSEKTPSFTVYPDSNSFYCFGCGAGGDVITFVRRVENLDYVEAVKSLAQRYGLNMPEDGYDDTLSKKRGRLMAANREAAGFFHHTLMSEHGKPALDYLLGRGLSMATVKRFGLGYAPNDWSGLLEHMRQKGYSQSELLEANLVRKSSKSERETYYDNFRNRVMVPIIDPRGNVIAFGGRVLDDSKPKYINTSDTLIYKKSQGVFALNFAKNDIKDGRLILAEGYMDVIALHQAGFLNAVAGLGTALTREQTRLLSRYADEVVLAYDSDEAGQAAAQKAIGLFGEIGVKVRVLKFEGGKDPDEIIRKYGAERFQRLIDGAANDTEYKLLNERGKYDLTTDDGKVSFMRAAIAVLASLDSAVERDIYASRLSDEVSVGKDAILIQVNELRSKRRKQQERERSRFTAKSLPGFGEGLNPEKKRNLRAAAAEEKLLSNLLNNPGFYPKLADKVKAENFVTELNRRIYEVLEKRLSENRGVELEFLSGSFSPEEMGAVNKLLVSGSAFGKAASQGLANQGSLEECIDCINIMFKEKLKKEKVSPSEMSDEEFLRRIRDKNLL
ncbi:MAG: DNA primase [Oscillospiraceae bacterium]|nr:DNA primase [Oscillospiraceae bacterium]